MNGGGFGEGWDDFATLLADALAELTVGEIVRLEGHDGATAGPRELVVRAYVIRHARHRARVAVGGSGRASLRHDARLAAAGWRPPSPWAGPDHHIDGDFADVGRLATNLVSAFRDIWRLPAPGVLLWTGRGAETFAAIQEPHVHRLGA